jgi:RNA 3'-phosphate cyclase
MSDFVEIDGEFGSGGGQILRTAVGLSALTGKACRIFNVRAKRSKPGLREQHLQAIRAVARLCGGNLRGDEIGSREISFEPQEVHSGDISIEISTAGSVGLVLQALLIAAMGKEVCMRISGGATFARWAVPVVYLREVLAPLLAQTGVLLNVEALREGFYPRGGARVEARVSGKPETAFSLTQREQIHSVSGVSIAARSLAAAGVAERQAKAALELVEKELGTRAHVTVRYDDTLCPGSGIVLWAQLSTLNSQLSTYIGASCVGERGKRSEDVGREAAQQLVTELREGCVDSHAGDQLLPWLAFARGAITVSEVTEHCRTNAFVIEKFLPIRFVFEPASPAGKAAIVTVAAA